MQEDHGRITVVIWKISHKQQGKDKYQLGRLSLKFEYYRVKMQKDKEGIMDELLWRFKRISTASQGQITNKFHGKYELAY